MLFKVHIFLINLMHKCFHFEMQLPVFLSVGGLLVMDCCVYASVYFINYVVNYADEVSTNITYCVFTKPVLIGYRHSILLHNIRHAQSTIFYAENLLLFGHHKRHGRISCIL